MRQSKLEQLREAKKKQYEPEYTTYDGLLRLLVDPNRGKNERRLNATQEAFINDPGYIKAYMGPAGCAKTSTLCAAGFVRALFMPGSKGLVARANYNDLQDTTMLRMQEMLNALPKGVLLDRDKSPPQKWYIQPIPWASPDGETDDTPSQITFMGLTDPLVGSEYDWIIIDEANEVVEQRIHEAQMRLRNKPKFFHHLEREGAKLPYSLMMAFNPPDKHHWLYTACTGKDFRERVIAEPWVKLFRPHNRENTRNLPNDYYESKAKTMPEEERQRYVEGEWGSTFDGQPVYREFRYNLHVKDGLRFSPYLPLLRGWDFGYSRPACVWTQIDEFGRLLVLREYLGFNQEARAFIEHCKGITAQFFPGSAAIVDYGDPAVAQKKDTGQTLAEFHKAGITMHYQSSHIDRGVQIIRHRLGLIIDGEPAMQFDRHNAPILIGALRGGYHLDDKGIKPVKDGHFDHLADAYRYLCYNLFNGSMPVTARSTKPFSQWIPETIEYDAREDERMWGKDVGVSLFATEE